MAQPQRGQPILQTMPRPPHPAATSRPLSISDLIIPSQILEDGGGTGTCSGRSRQILGRGGFGVVVVATVAATGEPIALKMVNLNRNI